MIWHDKKLYNKGMNLLKKTTSRLVLAFYVLTSVTLISSCVPGQVIESELAIHDLQGCDHTSPFNGRWVEGVTGIVTFKDAQGFYLQSKEIDASFCTSEAVYIFTEKYPKVYPGDLVSVDGKVSEYAPGKPNDLNLTTTEIVEPKIHVISTNNALPEPVFLDDLSNIIPRQIIEDDRFESFDPDKDGIDFYESLESMLVGIRLGRVIDGINPYDEIMLLPEPFEDGNLISNSGALLTTEADHNPEKIMVKAPNSGDPEIRVGDLINTPFVGVMTYSYGNFKVHTLQNLNPKQGSVDQKDYDLKSEGVTLATYNVENLSIAGGDKKIEALAIQIVEMLGSPDVLVLHEVMDDSGDVDDGIVSAEQTLGSLVDQIEDAGGPRYVYADNPPANNQDGGIPGGNIRSVLLYRPDRDLEMAAPDRGVNGIESTFGEIKVSQNPFRFGEEDNAFFGGRKPILWLLRKNGIQFAVLSLHLVSQGKNDPLWGSRQPILRPEENQRIDQARVIVDFTEKLRKIDQDIPILAAGDLNDLPWSPVLQVFETAGFTNTAALEETTERYSFIFDGDAQQLDYFLIDALHYGNVKQARFIHLNTQMDSRNQISDHDPLWIEMTLP